MNHELPKQYNAEARRDALRTSLEIELTNPTYRQYCNESGPLTLGKIDDELVDAGALQLVIENYGWPEDTGDDFYVSRNFELANFHQELFDKDIKNRMGNFRAKLATPLMHDMAELTPDMSMSRLHGLSPSLHRAYAVTPVLMTAVGELLTSFNHLPMFHAAAATSEYLKDDENAAALEAVFIAYNLMARLIRPEEGHPGDIDSHDALTH